MVIHSLLVVPPGLDSPRRDVPLERGRRLVAGRAVDADLVLSDPRVSSRHVELTPEGATLVARDLGSLNGTWLLDGDSRRRLDPEVETPVGADAALAVGPFLLVPCAELGPRVLLHSGWLGELPPPETPDEVSPPGADERARVADALGSVAAGGDPWSAVLRAALDLAGAVRGTLFALAGERFVLRSAATAGGPACLGQRFLERTAARTTAWCWQPVAEPDTGLLSATLLSAGPDAALLGVPFRAGGKVVAVACLESARRVSADRCAALTLFGTVAGAFVAPLLALERETRRREALENASPSGGRPDAAGPPLVGVSGGFRAAVEAIERAAPARATVLLRGPSGSGKEEFARLLHRLGPRREQPFVVVNAAAIPGGLVESELFGHERGAFTGAAERRAGAFERADGGTLFLDEVGDLALEAQAKILRVVESAEVTRLGGGRAQVDVRLVAATHRDLAQMVREGAFREDLYYRLRVVEIVLPSLAERNDDVLPLVAHFLAGFRKPDGGGVSGPTPAAVRSLERYAWPGNVRELRNVVERAVVLDRDGVLDVDDLPPEVAGGAHEKPAADDLLGLSWPAARDGFEARYFRQALERCAGRVADTARATGVDRRTISTKIRQLGFRTR